MNDLVAAYQNQDDPVTPTPSHDLAAQYRAQVLPDDHAAIAAAKARTAPADPDAYAEAMRLGRATGIPAPVAARNLDHVRQLKTAQDLQAFATSHPAAGQWMAQDDHAALAHDDTPALGRIAGAVTSINKLPDGHWGGDIRAPIWIPGPAPDRTTLWDTLVSAFTAPTDPNKRTVGMSESAARLAGQGEEELTALASKMAALPAGTLDAIAGLFQGGNRHELQDAVFRNVVDPQEELAQRLAIDPNTEQQSAAADVAGKVAHFVPGMTAAVATGGGAEAIPLKEGGSVALNWLKNALLKSAFASPGIAVPAGAAKFQEATNAGDSVPVAAAKDVGTMLETTAAMAVPLAGKTKTASAALGAVGMPAIQTLLSLLHGEGVPGTRDLVANSIIGTLTGAVFGPELAGKPTAIATAEHNAAQLDTIMDAANDSKLAQRSPEHLASLIDHVGEHTVYLPTEQVVEHFAGEGADPVQGILALTHNPDAIEEAHATGQVAIPLANYVTQGQDLHAALGDSAKLDEAGLSRAEISDAQEAHAGEMEQAATEAQPERISTKDALMQSARVARGEKPLEVVPMPGKEEELATAQKRMTDNPNAADEIIAKKLAGDTTISAADEAVLQVHAVDLTNQIEAQAQRASDPEATPAARDIARQKGEELAKKFDALNQATKITGAAWSHFGRQRMQELMKDYSFAALLRKETTRLQRPLEAPEIAKLKDQADRIAQLEAEAQTHAQALAQALRGKRSTGPKKSVDERAQTRLKADIAKLEADIMKRLSACPI